jgi:Fibronectin type III domain/Calcineurin-like phosphoesterase
MGVRRAGLAGLAVLVGLLCGGADVRGAVVADSVEPTWQTDGPVRAIAFGRGRIYIGGDFTHVRAPGTPSGGARRNHLAALDASTGALLPWNPNANGRVLALRMKPGSGTIYAGGTFTSIGGRPRVRIAAIATNGGTPRRWNPGVGARVDAIAATRRRVYIGGAFATVGGVGRHGVAAVSSGSGARVLAWNPGVRGGETHALALSTGGGRLFIGGSFTRVNGAPHAHLAAVDTATGRTRRLRAHPPWPVTSLVATPSALFVGGSARGGAVAAYAPTADGARRWIAIVDGGVRALALRQRILYVGGAFQNYCPGDTDIESPPACSTPTSRGRLLALNTSTATLSAWNPSADGAVLAIAGTAGQIDAGGSFTTVHATAQQGIAKFLGPRVAVTPPTNLSAAAVSATRIELTWNASATANITGYHVYRDSGAQPVATVNAPATNYADTGLQPSTLYRYTVTAFVAGAESAMSNQASATTQAGGAGVTVAAAGDIACNPSDPNYNNGNGQNGFCMQKATANLIAQGSYDKVLPLGDLQYDCGSRAAFDASYDAAWGQFLAKTEPVLGNHEVQATSAFPSETTCSTGGTGYYSYFADHGVTDAAGVNGNGYYSYDLGGWHILAINANCTQIGGCKTGDPEEAWVRAELASHPTQCTLAYWHQPPWSSTASGGVRNMRTIWADLVNGGVELVLTAHFHHYERYADLDATGQPAAPGAVGTREIIAGIGGESQGSFTGLTPAPGSQVRLTGYGVLALTLGSGSYSWQYRQIGGATADSGTEACHP